MEGPLNLSPLCVCRKLYAEAALLPYALNTFVFDDEVVLPRFGDALLPIQKEAVGKIMRRDRGVKGEYLGEYKIKECPRARLGQWPSRLY